MNSELELGNPPPWEPETNPLIKRIRTHENEKPILQQEYYVRNTVEALNSLERGSEFDTPLITTAILEDLGISYEYLERPNPYPVSNLVNFLEQVKTAIQKVLEKEGIPKIIGEAETLQKEIEEKEKNLFRCQLTLQKAATGQIGLEEALKTYSEAQREKEELKKAEGRKRQLDRIFWLIREDINSLREEEAEKRLERKKKQIEMFIRGVIGAKNVGEHLYAFTRLASNLEGVMNIFANNWVEKLFSSQIAAWTGMPGFKQAVDSAFRALLEMDVYQGKPQDNPLASFGWEQDRNLCQVEQGKLFPPVRDEFLNALRKKVTEELRGQRIPYPEFLAEKGVEAALALHEIFMLSAFWSWKRDPNTLEILPEEREKNGAGSMYGISNDAKEKVFDPANKLKEESLSGYPAPLTLAIADLSPFFFIDMMHAIKPNHEKNPNNQSAFDLLLEGKMELSEVFASIEEGSHNSWLYGLFQGCQTFVALGKIPREQIQIQRDKKHIAFKACGELADWLPSLRKTLEKGLLRALISLGWDKERATAEVNRVILNVVIAFWRKAVDINVWRGGDSANEERDFTGEARAAVETYLQEKLVREKGVITHDQFLLLEKLLAPKRGKFIISSKDIDRDPKLRGILAQQPSDVPPDESPKKKLLLRAG